MARYEHLPIFKSTYDLCLETYILTGHFKREYKYTLGEKIKQNAHSIMDLVIEANSLPNREKVLKLNCLMLEMEKLKMNCRILCDLKVLSPNSLGKISLKMEEIGKQISGWKNWIAKTATSCSV